MRNYKVEVTRDRRWWMITVPEIDGLTQARRISEIDDMARSLIAISTGTALAEIAVDIVTIHVPELGDISARAHEIDVARTTAMCAHDEAQHQTAAFSQALTKAGIPVRDTAELLKVSPQRISQLAKEAQTR